MFYSSKVIRQSENDKHWGYEMASVACMFLKQLYRYMFDSICNLLEH